MDFNIVLNGVSLWFSMDFSLVLNESMCWYIHLISSGRLTLMTLGNADLTIATSSNTATQTVNCHSRTNHRCSNTRTYERVSPSLPSALFTNPLPTWPTPLRADLHQPRRVHAFFTRRCKIQMVLFPPARVYHY